MKRWSSEALRDTDENPQRNETTACYATRAAVRVEEYQPHQDVKVEAKKGSHDAKPVNVHTAIQNRGTPLDRCKSRQRGSVPDPEWPALQ